MGDPRGVGPEIVVKALHAPSLPADVRLLIVGSRAVLDHAAAALGRNLALPAGDAGWTGGGNAVLDLDNLPATKLEPRMPDAASGRASVEYIEQAVQLIRKGKAEGLVTGPISKEAIGAAGSPFPGHTEMLAALSGGARPVMVLARPGLRVALVTTHVALRDVPAGLRTDEIVEAACVLADGLKRLFAVPAPRIAVCGLNPHCGDGGRFGDEEQRIVAPAVEQARERGVDLQGPRPADTVFAQAMRGDYDAVLALYHDQGMIPVKLAGLSEVVDVTLGLPFVRTGVGHGTAYDIAGSGQADERSLVAAIRLAVQMVRAAARS
jgi:4-hydroxythreonine-4-phosphate dehydrogenase